MDNDKPLELIAVLVCSSGGGGGGGGMLSLRGTAAVAALTQLSLSLFLILLGRNVHLPASLPLNPAPPGDAEPIMRSRGQSVCQSKRLLAGRSASRESDVTELDRVTQFTDRGVQASSCLDF